MPLSKRTCSHCHPPRRIVLHPDPLHLIKADIRVPAVLREYVLDRHAEGCANSGKAEQHQFDQGPVTQAGRRGDLLPGIFHSLLIIAFRTSCSYRQPRNRAVTDVVAAGDIRDPLIRSEACAGCSADRVSGAQRSGRPAAV
jgi:hypothetical protein